MKWESWSFECLQYFLRRLRKIYPQGKIMFQRREINRFSIISLKLDLLSQCSRQKAVCLQRWISTVDAKFGVLWSKLMLYRWWYHYGIFHFDFIYKKVNAEAYFKQLQSVHGKHPRKRHVIANKTNVLLLLYNANKQSARKPTEKLLDSSYSVQLQQPYSPNLALSNSHLFLFS